MIILLDGFEKKIIEGNEYCNLRGRSLNTEI